MRKISILGIALILFSVHAFELFYTNYLRKQATNWTTEQLIYNGQTTFGVPWLSGIGYIPKLNAIRNTGVPGDPYTQRPGLKTWFFDCIPNYLIYGFSRWFKRLDIGFTYFSYLVPSLWFLWGVYFFDKLFPGKNKQNILFAVILGGFLYPFCAMVGGISVGKILYYCFNFGVMHRGAVANMPSPQFTSLFALMWWGWLLVTEEKYWPLGLTVALMLLIHPPEWVFCCGILGSYWLCKRTKGLTLAVGVGAILSLILLVLGGAGSRAEKIPSIMTEARLPSLVYLFAGIVAWRLSEDKFWYLSMVTMFFTFLIMNLDLLLPFPMQFSVLERFAKPVLLIMIFAFISGLEFKSVERAAPALTCAALMVLLFNAKSSAEKHYRLAAMPRDWEEGFDWLNKNTNKGDTVLTISPLISQLLATHTHNKQIIGDGHPTMCSLSYGENIQNAAMIANTFGIDSKTFEKKYYSPQWGNLNLRFFYNDGRDITAYMWCLDGFLHVTQFPEQPYLKKILELVEQKEEYKGECYVWVNQGEEYKGTPVFESGRVRIYKRG